jgi:hypothetical protein
MSFVPAATPANIPAWNAITDNNPCGYPAILSAGGIDVSADTLCLFHSRLKYGQAATPGPYNTATKATAGIPATWAPAGATVPATPADVIAGNPYPITAAPLTAWTTGQYAQTQLAGAPGRVYWNGSAWIAGTAP